MMAPSRRATRNVVVGKLSILLDDPGNYLVNVIDRFLGGRVITGQKTAPIDRHTHRNSAPFRDSENGPLWVPQQRCTTLSA